MSANGISTLLTKELKQKAKLDLAATNRAADGNPRATYDITQLPTQSYLGTRNKLLRTIMLSVLHYKMRDLQLVVTHTRGRLTTTI